MGGVLVRAEELLRYTHSRRVCVYVIHVFSRCVCVWYVWGALVRAEELS